VYRFGVVKEGDASGIMEGVGSSLQYVFIIRSVLSVQGLNVSISVLGVMPHLLWATKWLDRFVDFVGLGFAGVNITNVVVGPCCLTSCSTL